MALDSSGNVYLSGSTTSVNFPITPGAFDQTYNDTGSYGYGDAFIAKLGSNLKVMLDLQAERRRIKSFSMVRDYGQIQFTR
ncbi:MAG: hypothetical protein M0C28_19255 [Candidatus Moduliflexus flocculans]|nr:hypothetical protein [Candidatus Moduliflexus flocculans]